MSKISKLLLTSLILFFIFLGITYIVIDSEVFASEEPMAISEENADTATSQVNSSLNALSSTSVTTISTVNSYDEANLKLNNILSIILIAIGILLILFSIAIIIRLKK